MIQNRTIDEYTPVQRTVTGKPGLSQKGAILYLLLILLIGGISPAAAEVTREVADQAPEPGSILNVSLHLPGDGFAGIVEEIPEGFEYITSSLPDTAVSRSGNILLFAVVGEDEITYQVRVPDTGDGVFSGRWTDIKTGGHEAIPDTLVTVRGSTQAARKSPESPGFASMMTFFALTVVGMVLAIRRRGSP